jgi:hypothetical protein
MSITCPASLQSVKTRDVPPRQACIQGQTSASTLRSQVKPPARSSVEAAVDIRVMIYSGHDIDIPPAPPDGATAADIDGQDWQACVPTGGLGAAGNALPGAALTVVAWQLTAGTATVETIMVEPFYGVVDTVVGAGECCTCSGSGSGAAPDELDGAAELDVAIPDGAYAGNHTARASGRGQWRLTLGKSDYTIRSAGGKPVASGPAGSAAASSVESSPYSATFPGSVFGAKGDVVVTVA